MSRRRSAVIALLVVAGAAFVVGSLASPQRAPSIIGELLSRSSQPTPRITPVPAPGHEVYGFVPYWEMEGGIVDHVAGTKLTTLGLFSVTHRRSGTLDTAQNGYRLITGDIGRRLARAAQDRGARVELVYTSFGQAKNERFCGDADAQAKTIDELVALTKQLGLDGIDVDVESLAATDIPAYGTFVGRLRSTLRDRVAGARLSVATGSGLRGASMAAAAMAAGVDRVFIMGYDYHSEDSAPGASAPLGRADGDLDLPTTLDLYLTAGVPVEQTILGLPLYGIAWPVSSAEPDALQIGRGDAWIPSDHLDVLHDPANVPTRDPVQVVERLVLKKGRGWQAIYYDSPATLEPKLALANDRGLAGAGLWALGYDQGVPGYATLIARFAAGRALSGS
jgi:spore germination protein YaaH